jgi:hypothetical protein
VGNFPQLFFPNLPIWDLKWELRFEWKVRWGLRDNIPLKPTHTKTHKSHIYKIKFSLSSTKNRRIPQIPFSSKMCYCIKPTKPILLS